MAFKVNSSPDMCLFIKYVFDMDKRMESILTPLYPVLNGQEELKFDDPELALASIREKAKTMAKEALAKKMAAERKPMSEKKRVSFEQRKYEQAFHDLVFLNTVARSYFQPADLEFYGYEFTQLLKNFRVFEDEFLDDPYLNRVHFDEPHTSGRFELSMAHQNALEPFLYDNPKQEKYVDNIHQIGVLTKSFSFPVIAEDHRTWMSITPHEINTMREDIKKAHGNVLTLGCGLGYFAYMAALKSNVDSVTIVEKEPDVIHLFKTYILPQFGDEVAAKIKVVEADAFDFMEELEDGVYNFCFADIWLNRNDALVYFKLLHICSKFKKMQMAYWIEDEFYRSLSSYIKVEIAHSAAQSLGVSTENLNHVFPKKERKIRQIMLRLLENEVISTPTDLKRCLDPNYLKRQARKL